LVQVALAPGALRRLADLLDGGEQKADQDRDDGDDDQQLDQGEPFSRRLAEHNPIPTTGIDESRRTSVRRSDALRRASESAGLGERIGGRGGGGRRGRAGASLSPPKPLTRQP